MVQLPVILAQLRRWHARAAAGEGHCWPHWMQAVQGTALVRGHLGLFQMEQSAQVGAWPRAPTRVAVKVRAQWWQVSWMRSSGLRGWRVRYSRK